MGVVVGDALGCPVQFESRDEVIERPITGMRGYGTFNMPEGSWTDGSSETLALPDSILRKGGIDCMDIMDNLVKWLDDGAFTPFGYAYDIGSGVMNAVRRYKIDGDPLTCGGRDERNCGKGSASTLNVARGGDVPEERLEEFRANETYEVGDFRIRAIPSLHSKPTILNNDLGQTIDAPLRQPASLRDHKEGGSYDFHIEAGGRQYVVRPSFNYIVGQLDGLHADVLFLGVAGLQKADAETERAFFSETIDQLKPSLVIPVHWDNFFSPLTKPAKGMPRLIEKTGVALFKLARACEARGIDCAILLPGSSMEL